MDSPKKAVNSSCVVSTTFVVSNKPKEPSPSLLSSMNLKPKSGNGGSSVASPSVGRCLSSNQRRPCQALLSNHKTWSQDTSLYASWRRRRLNHRLGRGHSMAVTDDDIEELRACFELGFSFDTTKLDPKLSKTFPALTLYTSINQSLSNTTSVEAIESSTGANCGGDGDPTQTPPKSEINSIINPGDDPDTIKTKLKQWARVVAISTHASIYSE